MINRIISGFFLLLYFNNCSNNNNNNNDNELNFKRGQYFGVIISNSGRHGRPNSFFNISTSISNDTLIPFHLKISFSKEYVHNNKKFKIILLPESMTVEKFSNPDFYISEAQKFLQTENTIRIDKIIKPKENYIINIAFLNESNSNVVPGQLALISKLHKFNFTSIPDSLIKLDKPINDSLNIFLGLNFSILTDSLYGFKIIPCGTIYYSK